MKVKSVAALLAASTLVVNETIALEQRKHIHAEILTETVVSAGSYMAAFGRTLRSVMRDVNNGVVGETFLYELELPFVQTVQIVHHVKRVPGWGLCRCWQFRFISRGVCGEWMGKFDSAMEAALAAQARPAILLQ